MKKFNIALVAFCLFGFGTTIQAQNSIPASGGNAAGAGGSASYTVGQIVYTTNTGTNGSAVQGVQQAFEISVVTGIKESKGIDLIFSAYPNPTTNFLTLKVENYDKGNLSYQLYDINGTLLENKKIKCNETIISLENHISAIYFLKVTDNNKEVKTFKVIKN